MSSFLDQTNPKIFINKQLALGVVTYKSFSLQSSSHMLNRV